MIKYDKLWETMKKKGVTTYTLRYEYGLSGNTIQNLRKGKDVNTCTIDALCEILDCRVEDIIEYIPNAEKRRSIKNDPLY